MKGRRVWEERSTTEVPQSPTHERQRSLSVAGRVQVTGRNDDRGGFRRPGQDRFEGRPEKATPGDDEADDGCRGDRVPLHRLFPKALRQGVETFALKLRPVLDRRALRPGDGSCLCVQRGPGPWSLVPASTAVLA